MADSELPASEMTIDAEAVTVEPTIRESIIAARDELSAEPEDAPSRDESGRFKAKEEASTAPETSLVGEVPAEPLDAPVRPPIEIEPAPPSWGADAKAKWAEVPPEVRAEFTKRETEMRHVVGNQDRERLFGRAVNEVVNPYMPMMKAANLNPVQEIGNLMNTAYVLNTGDAQKKAQTLAMIADQYGIDMDAAYQFRGQATALKNVAPVEPPVDIDAKVEAAIAQREMARETQAFMADPKNEHFEVVKPLMAAMLESGEATTLQAAYDMAVYARPDLRSTRIAAEVAARAAQQEVTLRTTQAKRAAVSLPGSSGSPRPTGTFETSLRDELRNGLRSMSSTA